MIYKKVPLIKEELSAIGVGCWNFGGDWDSSERKTAIEIVHKAIELGVNFFDVAPIYGCGIAETVLGEALSGGKREKVIIGSKCGLVWDYNKNVSNNLSKESILKEIDDSLKRLNTDYIDIYQLHWPDKSTPLEETAEALKILLDQGKIKYIGMSNFNQNDVEKMMEYVPVHAQQSLYNMLERNPRTYHAITLEYKTEDEVLKTVKEKGQAFFPYSPLFQGLLAGEFKFGTTFSEKDVRSANPKLAGELFEKYFKGAEKLDNIAKEIQKPLNELALNWLRQNLQVTSIIAGVSSISQLENNLKSMEWNIDEETMKKIDVVLEDFKSI